MSGPCHIALEHCTLKSSTLPTELIWKTFLKHAFCRAQPLVRDIQIEKTIVLLTNSRKMCTIISFPSEAALIKGVNPRSGSLKIFKFIYIFKENTNTQNHPTGG